MAKISAIEWCDSSWSPWRGCTKVSAGCAHCYAERRAKRVGEDFGMIVRSKTTLGDPLKWKEPRKIFVGHLSDFAHEEVPLAWVDDAWEIMREASQHTYLILTKRPHDLAQLLPEDWGGGWPNVWIGATVENADNEWRLVALEEIRAQVKFVSAEPLLGPLTNLSSFFPSLDWVIVGGESGPNHRHMKPEWAREIRDACIRNNVAFFFKQQGGAKKINGIWGGQLLDGKTYRYFPGEFEPR